GEKDERGRDTRQRTHALSIGALLLDTRRDRRDDRTDQQHGAEAGQEQRAFGEHDARREDEVARWEQGDAYPGDAEARRRIPPAQDDTEQQHRAEQRESWKLRE